MTEDQVQMGVYYGDPQKGMGRVVAYSWHYGDNGVNYAIEGVNTFMPMYCSKVEFLDMIENGGVVR